MNKIFMNRSVDLNETIYNQKIFIDNTVSYKLTMRNHSDIFYTSKIQIDDHSYRETMYSTTMGKGCTESECLASNYGELIERFSYQKWIDNHNISDIINLTNMKTKEIYTSSVEDIRAFKGTEASGNNVEEARYHALCEVYEFGFNNNFFRDIPVKTFIVKTEDMFPEIPKIIHDNIVVIVNKDDRIPLYDLIVLKNPNHSDFFMNDLITVNNKTISIPKANWDTSNPNNLANRNIMFPVLTGRRIGMNIKKLFKIAVSEMLQFLESDLLLHSNNLKKELNYIETINANDLLEFETSTIEEDNNILIDSFNDAGYNLWEIDMTYNEKFPVVKIIHDYTLGASHPCSKQFLSKYFKEEI